MEDNLIARPVMSSRIVDMFVLKSSAAQVASFAAVADDGVAERRCAVRGGL